MKTCHSNQPEAVYYWEMTKSGWKPYLESHKTWVDDEDQRVKHCKKPWIY